MRNYYKHHQKSSYRGFTFIEVLLSVSIIAIFATMSFPVFLSFQQKNDLEISALHTVQALRRAQIRSQGGENDSSWGVKIQNEGMTIFKGMTYSTRDQTMDEFWNISGAITPSETTEIVYEKISGLPSGSVSIIFTSKSLNESKTITVNTKGVITY